MRIRTRTLTVVFTDMVNYTRTVSGSDREGLRNLLALHEQRVGPILRGRRGRIVKNIGDSFMALFESATDAVRACLDLMESNPVGEGAEVAFRASVATGDVEETDTDAFGETCNLSARINARTPPGEVWFSASTLLCMNQAEIPWETVGRFPLKGLPGEMELHRAVPQHAMVLPEVIARAATQRMVVRWSSGEPPPQVPPGAQILLEGFRPGSPYLQSSIEQLPVVDSSHIWLCTYNISPLDRYEWQRTGRGLVIGTPAALKAALEKQARPQRKAGTDTLILDAMPAAWELVVAGLALPAVSAAGPLQEVVAGYSYYFTSDGRWVNQSDRALLRVDVDGPRAQLLVLSPGVSINGRGCPVNTTVPLEAGLEIGALDLRLRYQVLGREGYLGALVGETQLKVSFDWGQTVEMGREPNHPGLLLPARNSQDNIRWCSGNRAARAREKGFTLDNVLTGRRHASVVATQDRLSLSSIHDSCPTLLWRGELLSRLVAGSTPATLEPGDLLIAGTTAVRLGKGA